jgi:hypothetical protein
MSLFLEFHEFKSEAERLRLRARRPLARRWFVIATVVVAALAFGVTAAPGGDRAGVRVPEIVSLHPSPMPDFVDRFVASHKASVSPASVRVPEIVSLHPSGSPDFVDRYVAAHQAPGSPSAQPSTPSSRGDSFDWGSAGIGASMTAVLLLVLAGAIGMVRRSGTHSAAA